MLDPTRMQERIAAYTDAEIGSLIRAFSEDRLSMFLEMAGGNIHQALRLYDCNIILSEALYLPLHGVEICLRNSIHRALSDGCKRPDWYDDPRLPLANPQKQTLEKAKASLASKGKPLAPGRIVAELPFGFWVGLLGKHYAKTQLWGGHLRKAFPHHAALQRKQCHSLLQPLRELRNRIAHHEPILMRDLQADHDRLLTVSGWMCPVTRRWIQERSRFPQTFRQLHRAAPTGKAAADFKRDISETKA